MLEIKEPTRQELMSAFEANLGYLVTSGIWDAVVDEAKRTEGLNDETLWQCHGRQFMGFPEVRLAFKKPYKVKGGEETKSVGLVYDGKTLTVLGSVNENTFNVTLGSPVANEEMEKIKDALKQSFGSPEIRFISNEDLWSSD